MNQNFNQLFGNLSNLVLTQVLVLLANESEKFVRVDLKRLDQHESWIRHMNFFNWLGTGMIQVFQYFEVFSTLFYQVCVSLFMALYLSYYWPVKGLIAWLAVDRALWLAIVTDVDDFLRDWEIFE